MSHALSSPHRVTRRATAAASPRRRPPCRVCGSDEVRTDEVAGHVALVLGECGRCGDRWTRPAERPPFAASAAFATAAPSVAARLEAPDGGGYREIPDAA